MILKVLLPNEVFLQQQVTKVIAEAENGYFCLLPHHVDFTAALVSGLLTLTTSDGREQYLAIAEGILVKCGTEVSISTRSAARSDNLGDLKQIVRRQFEALDERERMARSATARLEAGLVRRFLGLRNHAV